VKLQIISDTDTFDEICAKVNSYFGMEMRFIPCKMSLFEQYDIRPVERKFIPSIWKYRIVVRNGKYFFGCPGSDAGPSAM
jgi:hypothetical protein